MSTHEGERSPASLSLSYVSFEPLERRDLFAIARPDHVVIVVEQDRASNAIGNPIWSYLNQLASTGLVYTNSHGVAHPSEPNTLALYSGSTQGIADNGRNHSFGGANLARSLFNAGLSFSGYVENLPTDGSQVTQAGDGVYPDLYTRNMNAMAQFTDIGIDPATGRPRANAVVNRTFGAFAALPTTDYSSLPTVSFIVPNTLHSAHGSNERAPWAGSPDEGNNDILRRNADSWLAANLDAYLQWAKANNSLLIVTQDEERWTGGTAQTVTTVVNGDPDLFNPGTNGDHVNHFNLLRTITDMYGLAPLGVTGTYPPLDTDASGQLAPDAPPAPIGIGTTTAVTSGAAPSVFGQPVTLSATVTAGSGSAMPTGVVTFKNGATTLGTAILDGAGVATLTTSTLTAGSHAIAAVYAGSDTFAASTSAAVTHTVAKAPSNTNLAASLASSLFGQGVTFSATVSGQGGTVTFMDGSVALGSVAVDATGRASVTTSGLSSGPHSITAMYSGGSNHAGSGSAALAFTVSPASTTVGVTAAASPSAVGQPVQFTATVAPVAPGSGAVTGTVQFLINGTVFGGPVAVVNGLATSGATTTLAAGSHAVTAVYSGSANHLAATSSPHAHVVSSTPPPAPVPLPANMFADRTTLNGAVVIATGSSTGATLESLEPRHDGNRGGRSVWWTWTAPESGTVIIDTLGSNFDTILAVYRGTAVSTLTRVTSNDDAPGGLLSSRVSFAAVAGREYQIAVDGYNGVWGKIVLRLHMAAKAPTGVAASDGSFDDRVRVTWNPATGATAYELWRGTSSSGAGAVKIADVTGTEFDDTTAAAGQTWWYFVKAKNAVSTSSLGAADSGFRAIAPPPVPETTLQSTATGDALAGGLFEGLEEWYATR